MALGWFALCDIEEGDLEAVDGVLQPICGEDGLEHLGRVVLEDDHVAMQRPTHAAGRRLWHVHLQVLAVRALLGEREQFERRDEQRPAEQVEPVLHALGRVLPRGVEGVAHAVEQAIVAAVANRVQTAVAGVPACDRLRRDLCVRMCDGVGAEGRRASGRNWVGWPEHTMSIRREDGTGDSVQ